MKTNALKNIFLNLTFAASSCDRRQLANHVVAFYEHLTWGVLDLVSASGDGLVVPPGGPHRPRPQELMPCRRAHARNDNRYAKLARFGILKMLKL